MSAVQRGVYKSVEDVRRDVLHRTASWERNERPVRKSDVVEAFIRAARKNEDEGANDHANEISRMMREPMQGALAASFR